MELKIFTYSSSLPAQMTAWPDWVIRLPDNKLHNEQTSILPSTAVRNPLFYSFKSIVILFQLFQ